MTADSKKGTASATPQPTEGDSRATSRTVTPADVNIAMRCVLKSNVDRLVKAFEDEEDQFHNSVSEMISERDDDGRCPLDMAGILGRVGMAKELVTRGADINATSKNGKGIYVTV